MAKPLAILKIGTSSITKDDGELDEPIMVDIARQIVQLHPHYNLVIVSSGAVGTGKSFIKNYSGKMKERKAAAAIGNPILINKYAQFFAPYKIPIAQSLCERHHFSNRKQFLQLRETFEELWASGIIPIANENDVVSSYELQFSDNDELAALLAIGFEADVLLLGTSVDGVLDHENKIIPRIEHFNAETMGFARTDMTSTMGLGGMTSKLTFARLATQMGINVVIFGVKNPDSIIKAVNKETGTVCPAQECNINARLKWLASGSLVTGRICVDSGAKEALLNRKSLLIVGIKNVERPFEAGEVFEIVVENEQLPFAIGLAKISSSDIGSTDASMLAHVDDIVLV